MASPACPSRRLWIAPVLSVLVVLDDVLLIPRAHDYRVLGLLDEPAHLATTVVGLLVAARALPRSLRPDLSFAAGAILAGNLIDLDHIPSMLGYEFLTRGTPRPYSHSLSTVAAVLVFAATRGRTRRIMSGVAFGVLLHLFRDTGTGQVSLLWPWSRTPTQVPYAAYATGLGALAVAPLLSRRAIAVTARLNGRARSVAG